MITCWQKQLSALKCNYKIIFSLTNFNKIMELLATSLVDKSLL